MPSNYGFEADKGKLVYNSDFDGALNLIEYFIIGI